MTLGSGFTVGAWAVSACFALPLKAATAAMTLLAFFGEGGGSGAMGLTLKSLVALSVLDLLSVGRAGLLFVGEASFWRPSLPCVSDRGMRSLLLLREKVSSSDVVDELAANMDLGRGLEAGRAAGCW